MDGESVSPTFVNSIRPRYAEMTVVILPKVVKPATYGEEICICTHWTVRGGWRGRALKVNSRSWEIR